MEGSQEKQPKCKLPKEEQLVDMEKSPQQNAWKDECEAQYSTLQANVNKKSRLAFTIDERPSFHIALFYGFQVIMTNLPGSITAVFVIHSSVCGGNDYEFMAKLMSTSIFMTGLASLLQVLFGSRLPITQGSSFVFLSPIIAMMSMDKWKCPSGIGVSNVNGTSHDVQNVSFGIESIDEPEWKPRVAQISGAIIASSVVQFVLGITGLIGFLTNYVGPIPLASTILVLGISLHPVAIDASKHQWGVAFLTVALIVVFTTVLAETQVPIINWTRSKGFYIKRYPLLRMFSTFLAITISWILCYILTITGVLPSDKNSIGYYARTDAKLISMERIEWFYIPHPGQFGAPTFGADIFAGMLAATIASILESLADYNATARICEIPDPPSHAVTRGIAVEGFCSILSGLYGTCHGTTSYSNVIGFIAYSGVASRWAWVAMSVMVMAIAMFGKVAGALASIPEPIIGGMTILGLGLMILVGMNQLHAVDLTSTRNQVAIGLALMLGLMLPQYTKENPDMIKTGSENADGLIRIFLSTGPFVAGVVGLIIDNILPGTRLERGMAHIGHDPEGHEISKERYRQIFYFPFPTEKLKKIKFFTFIPCLPCYKSRRVLRFWQKNRTAAEDKEKQAPESDASSVRPIAHLTSL